MNRGVRFTRRAWMAAGAGLWLAETGRGHDGRADDSKAQPSAAEALARLKEGNLRFAAGRVRHAHQAASWREHLTETQTPFATILACSDSRVPPELVFDQGLGDLFVIRVAGNVVASDVVGSIQYAVAHLHTPLVLVMGHEGCGAVTAAVESLAGRGTEPRYIRSLVDRIRPGLARLPDALTGSERVHAAVEANVRWTIGQLAALPEGKAALGHKRVALAGAVYELTTGRVRFVV